MLSVGVLFFDYQQPEQDRLIFHMESDWQPDSEALGTLISEMENSEQGLGRSRFGLRFIGESQTHWFDKVLVSDEVELPEELEIALSWKSEQFTHAGVMAHNTIFSYIPG
jgi:hypothetical protein